VTEGQTDRQTDRHRDCILRGKQDALNK